jgi:enterochelin esterase-like enzyme
VDGRNGGDRSDTEWAGPYERLVLETVRAVDARWPTLRDRAARAVTGNSEGAFGAMNVALHHLDTFGTVESWSGYFRATRSGPFAGAGDARLRAWSPADYVASLSRRLHRRPLHAFLYVGEADADRGLSTTFAGQLHAAGAQVRYTEYPGRHSWRLWRDTAPTALAFASRWFRP